MLKSNVTVTSECLEAKLRLPETLRGNVDADYIRLGVQEDSRGLSREGRHGH